MGTGTASCRSRSPFWLAHPPEIGTERPRACAWAAPIARSGTRTPSHPERSADNFELGHLGGLDILNADLRRELFDDTEEVRSRGRAGHQRLLHSSFIAGFAKEDVQRHFAEEGDAELFGLP